MEPTLHRVVLTMCAACLDGQGEQCHTPGCALIRSRCPDLPLRNRPDVETIDGVPFDYDTLKRAESAPAAPRAGSPAHVALWDAINEYARVWEHDGNTSVVRQLAVVRVETSLREYLRESEP